MSSPNFHTSSPGRLSMSNGKKRKKSEDHSDSADSHDEGVGMPKAKRACNECRQQKLKCDVQTDPYIRCSRCSKLSLECRIDANFKRVGKRSKHAEMEREIVELRQQLAQYRDLHGDDASSITGSTRYLDQKSNAYSANLGQLDPTDALHHGAADSLLNLSRSTSSRQSQTKRDATKPRTIGDVTLTGARIDELFQEYYTFYHPFLPILDSSKTPNQIEDLCHLLFWIVIVVASRRFAEDADLLAKLDGPVSKLIADTIFANPQNYHVVKALAIICTWPLPKQRTSEDLTYLFSGLMMEIALQTGLHRPSRVQDFYNRQRIELREEDLRDRRRTWVCCNVVAQEISTAFGQPPRTVYDYSLTSLRRPLANDNQGVSLELYWRLQIERFCNRVSQNFYNNRTNTVGIASAEERAVWMNVLWDEHQKLRDEIDQQGSEINKLYIYAAGLHLHLAAFFDSSTAPNYVKDLLNLWFATTSFLRHVFDLKIGPEPALRYMTHHILMIILGAGTSLMRLLNSFFAKHVDAENGRTMFGDTLRSVRTLSVRKDDLPARLAEALAQLWRYYREGDGRVESTNSADDHLKLKIQARGSMSVLFDSVWQWREQFSFPYGGSTSRLDSASNNPTLPEAVVLDEAAAVAVSNMEFDVFNNDIMTPAGAGYTNYQLDPNFDLFDPVSVMLDTPLLNFPYDNSAGISYLDTNNGFYN